MRKLALLLLLLGGQVAPAQTVSGTITGTVKDPSDAVIVNATITLINEATGATRQAATNEAGLYTFNSVQPGAYTLRVEESGFKVFIRTAITLTANERRPVDVRLEMGTSAETVEVQSQGATINTVSAERSGVVTSSQMDTLQLKGRDYMGMLRLLPGVVDTRNRDAPGAGSNSGYNIQGLALRHHQRHAGRRHQHGRRQRWRQLLRPFHGRGGGNEGAAHQLPGRVRAQRRGHHQRGVEGGHAPVPRQRLRVQTQ